MPHSETPEPLPPDLLALERELAARPVPGPPTELRARVLAAVIQERPGLVVQPSRLHRAGETPAPLNRGGFGRFAAATAAAALVAINLSASLANDTNWRLRPVGPDVAADRLRALDPDMPAREARRQALGLRAAAGLTVTPAPAADRILRTKEPDRWATH